MLTGSHEAELTASDKPVVGHMYYRMAHDDPFEPGGLAWARIIAICGDVIHYEVPGDERNGSYTIAAWSKWNWRQAAAPYRNNEEG